MRMMPPQLCPAMIPCHDARHDALQCAKNESGEEVPQGMFGNRETKGIKCLAISKRCRISDADVD